IYPNRLKIDQLKNHLSNRVICYECVNNKHDLVSLLENALSQEMEKTENQENQLLSTDMLNLDREI
ncbi:14661_t:CDS:2, partial [Funneliformis geosporum]